MSKSHKRHCSTGSRIHDQSLLEFCDKIAMSPMYMSWSPCAWHQLIRALSHVPMHQKQGTCAFPMHSCILKLKLWIVHLQGVICVAFHNQVKKPTVLRCICSTLLPAGAKDNGALDFSQLMIREAAQRWGNKSWKFWKENWNICHPPRKYGHKMHTSCNNHKCSWQLSQLAQCALMA
jgi:hypothetical protein